MRKQYGLSTRLIILGVSVTALACGGGTGVTDSPVSRRYFPVNLLESGNPALFQLNGTTLTKQIDGAALPPVPTFSVGNRSIVYKETSFSNFTVIAESSFTLKTVQTNDPRQVLVAFGRGSKPGLIAVPFRNLEGNPNMVSFSYAAYVDGTTMPVLADLYIVPVGTTGLGAFTPVVSAVSAAEGALPTDRTRQVFGDFLGAKDVVVTMSGQPTRVLARETVTFTTRREYFFLLGRQANTAKLFRFDSNY